MLCAGMGISKPVVSRLVDSLCRKEFLEKEACAADHRSYYLCITEKGREELDHTYKYYLEPLYSMRRMAGEENFARLMELIRLVNHQAGESGETKQ